VAIGGLLMGLLGLLVGIGRGHTWRIGRPLGACGVCARGGSAILRSR
jgi:hypothetical protein